MCYVSRWKTIIKMWYMHMICNFQLLTMTTDDVSLCKETALHVTGYENEKKN